MKLNKVSNLHFIDRFQKIAFLCFVLFLFAGFYACKKKGDLKPIFEKNHFDSQYNESLNILCSIEKADSLPTQFLSSSMLGILNDGTFGITHAGFYTQITLSSSSVDFGNISDLKADSIVLSLDYSGIYGNLNQAIPITVYRLSADMNKDNYYANDTIAYQRPYIGYSEFIPSPFDSVMVDSSMEAPQVRVRLDKQLANDILQQGSFADNAAFLNFIKGLYVIAEPHVNTQAGGGTGNTSTHRHGYYDPIPTQNKGIMCNFNLLSAFSGITIYYTNTVTNKNRSYKFNIDNTAKEFTVFKHNYKNTIVQDCLTNSNNDTLHTYLQGMDGPTIKLDISDWKDFEKENKDKIAISKAVLYLPVAKNSAKHFNPPQKIVLVGLDKNGGRNFLADYYEGGDHFGGDYNAQSKSYEFNITRHLNRLLADKEENYGYEILVSGRAIDASRVVLNSNQNTSNPMQLKIYYDKIK